MADTKVILGTAFVTDKGEWVKGTTYEENDIVHTTDGVYMSLVDNNTAETTDTSSWRVWVDKADINATVDAAVRKSETDTAAAVKNAEAATEAANTAAATANTAATTIDDKIATKAEQTDLDATNAEVAKKAAQSDLDATNKEVAKKADSATTFAGYGLSQAIAQEIGNSYDGVFIMFHRKSDNNPLIVKPMYWTSYQNSGEIAEGVVIVEGGHILVVAPTETSGYWSSANVSGGGTTTSDRLTALADWNGKSSTAAQVTHSECSGAAYAPGFCNEYSRTNANGKGLTAGRWWLPSLGEMMMIYANMLKVNYALSLITGATQLQRDAYWTSTESSSAHAWLLSLVDGIANTWYAKAAGSIHVRPVSAFLQ